MSSKSRKNKSTAQPENVRTVTRSLISTGMTDFLGSSRPSSSGIVINELTAMNLTAIWRGVNVLANDLSKLPLNVFRHLPNGKGKHPEYHHDVFKLLSYPNAFQTGRKLRQATMAHVVLYGNSYQEIIRDPETGQATALQLLDPRYVFPFRQDNGDLVYRFRGSKSPWTGKSQILAENCLHFANLTINGDTGLSGIHVCADSIGLSLGVQEYAGNLFTNLAVPQGYIECPPGWDELARQNFRTSWYQEHGGISGSNRVGILEEGAKFVATSFNPEQLQLLSIREFTVKEVARILGIPASKLGDMSNEASRSLSESNRDYYETSVLPFAVNIEDEYALKLFTQEERSTLFVQHNMNSLMREPDSIRAATNEIRMRNGVLTINEWRAEDGRNPFETDGRVLPLNMDIMSDTSLDLEPSPEEGDPTSEEQPQDSDVVVAARSVARSALDKIVRREVKNLQKHIVEGKVDSQWAAKYYDKDAAIWRDALVPALTVYAVAKGSRVDPSRVVNIAIERSRTAAIESKNITELLERWTATKGAEILAEMEEM